MNKGIAPIFLLFLFSACAAGHSVRYPPVRWLDDRDKEPIPMPKKVEEYKYWDIVDKQFFYQLARLGDLPERFGAALSYLGIESKQEALNLNNFDEVADSTWFTNRLGRQMMSVEEIVRGPGAGKGPDRSGEWTVLTAKTQGVTPGFLIEDRNKERFLLKFDPGGHMEMATGAEIISSKVFHAVGYNVPENSLVLFEPKMLKIDPKATTEDEKGKKRPFTQEDLDSLLYRLPVYRSGQYRALASKFIPGKLLGPFSFLGTHPTDINDRIPHQHRRELRGYRVFAAFLNHTDPREANTLDTFITEGDGKYGYIRHYLLDFGATIGSASIRPRKKEHLYDYTFNYGRNMARLLALGAYTPYWEKAESPDYPALGFFESKVFEPEHWRPSYPNPAFQNMTNRDGFWATKILMRLSDETIAAIVKEARYSNPAVTEYITKTLIERRNKIGRYWYNVLNPLDEFQLKDGGQGVLVEFEDLAVKTGFEKGNTLYRYRVRDQFGKRVLQEWTEFSGPSLLVSREIFQAMRPGSFYVIQIETLREGRRFWSPPVDLIFRGGGPEAGGVPQLLGLRRKYSA